MLSGVGQNAKQLLEEAASDLRVRLVETTFVSLQDLRSVGPLVLCRNFNDDIQNTFQNTNLKEHQAILKRRSKGTTGAHYAEGVLVFCGNEVSVQGRYMQSIGQIMSVISSAMVQN